jgi:hypothetical protein
MPNSNEVCQGYMALHCMSFVAGYSLIYNPWLCLIFEAMESVTSSLSFTAAVTYAAKLSTTTTDSSVQGLLGGLYFGVGKSLLGSGSVMEPVLNVIRFQFSATKRSDPSPLAVAMETRGKHGNIILKLRKISTTF